MKEIVIKLTESMLGCTITVDGKPLGLVQSVKAEVSVNDSSPKVEITFPDLRGFSTDLRTTLAANLEILEQYPFVEVKFEELVFDETEEILPPVAEWSSSELPNDPSELSKWDNLINVKAE